MSLFLLLVFAGLIGNAAACLAGGLAGSLALAAATVFRALAQIAGLQGNNSLHVQIILFSYVPASKAAVLFG